MAVGLADKLAVDLVKNQVDVTRYAETVKLYVQSLLSGIQDKIVGQLAGKDPTEPVRTQYQQQRLQQILGEVNALIDQGYKGIKEETSSSLYDFARVQQASVLGIVNGHIGTELLTHALTNEQLKQIASDTLINGAKSADWWSKQTEEMKFAFEREMREGMVRGESLGELIQRVRGKRAWKDQPSRDAVPGFFDKSYVQAEALVRTSVMTVANQTHLDVYAANADVISAIQWISTLDLRTTPTCQGLDGKSWDVKTLAPIGHELQFPGPTAHWNCRSTQIPITKTWEQLATKNKELARKMDEIPDSTRASMDGQVSQKMTYEDFLNKLPEEKQKDILGNKYDLWNKTKGLPVTDPTRVTLADMLNQRGNPLSLSEFAEKAGYKIDHPDEIRAHIARLEEEAKRLGSEAGKAAAEAARLEEAKKAAEALKLQREEELKLKLERDKITKDLQARFKREDTYMKKYGSDASIEKLISRLETEQSAINTSLKYFEEHPEIYKNMDLRNQIYKARLAELTKRIEDAKIKKLALEAIKSASFKVGESIEFADAKYVKDHLAPTEKLIAKEVKGLVTRFSNRVEEMGFDKRFFRINGLTRIEWEVNPARGGCYNPRYRSITISSYGNSVATMTHEFGHHLDYAFLWEHSGFMSGAINREKALALRSKILGEYRKIQAILKTEIKGWDAVDAGATIDHNKKFGYRVKSVLRDYKLHAPSTYALTNEREWIAETFEMYMNKTARFSELYPEAFQAYEEFRQGTIFI